METYSLQPFGLDATKGPEQLVEKDPFSFRLCAVLPDEVAAVAARLGALALGRHAPLERSIAALDRVGRLWSDPGYPPRQEALRVLPALTHLSPEMVERELAELCQLLRRDTLWEWVERELGSRRIMDSWVERGGFDVRREPRGLVFHGLSGNVFLLPALAVVFGLLTKNATLINVDRAEPYFGFRFAESLRDVAPEVAERIAVLHWPADDDACYRALFGQGLGVAVGWGDVSLVRRIAGLAGQHRVRFVDHGARIGVAVVDRIERGDLARVADDLARDIVPWEGYACISPPFIFVVEGAVTARELADALLSSMDALRGRLHPRVTVARHSALIAAREYYFFHLEVEGRGKVLTSHPGGATVIYAERPPTVKDLEVCGGMVMVCRASRPEEVAAALVEGRLVELCQALAFHGAGSECVDQLAELGISHVTRPGRLNAKETGFSHDGVLNLQELTRLVTRSR